MLRKRVVIKGRVQGVYYRDSTKRKADSLGIKGWVKNLPSGDVEALFEGEKDSIEKMLEWVWEGPAMSVVRAVDVTDEDPSNDYEEFSIVI